jgi:hypothetical protein
MSENVNINEKFIKYLNNIEITEENLQKRILDIFEFYKNHLCPEPIQDIFVTDYITEELREYENLWFFSENYAMEAKKFISEDDFDITLLRKINRIEIQKTNYDFRQANLKSRLILFSDSASMFVEMKASKKIVTI